jgi:cytochrome c
MNGRCVIRAAALMIALQLFWMNAVFAQMDIPSPAKPTGAEFFKRQCATCHTTNSTDIQRQGPSLAGIAGRKAGTIAGFKYSPALAKADFVWTDDKLDAWLIDPQAVVPGAIMPYRQAAVDIRAAIISYLKELH